MDMAPSPGAALDTSAYVKVDQTKLLAPPKLPRPSNDLRNRLDLLVQDFHLSHFVHLMQHNQYYLFLLL
jgi:hypothetical protein